MLGVPAFTTQALPCSRMIGSTHWATQATPPIYERAYAARPLHFKFTFFTTKSVPTLMGFIVGLHSFSSAASKAFFSQHPLLAKGATNCHWYIPGWAHWGCTCSPRVPQHSRVLKILAVYNTASGYVPRVAAVCSSLSQQVVLVKEGFRSSAGKTM